MGESSHQSSTFIWIWAAHYAFTASARLDKCDTKSRQSVVVRTAPVDMPSHYWYFIAVDQYGGQLLDTGGGLLLLLFMLLLLLTLLPLLPRLFGNIVRIRNYR